MCIHGYTHTLAFFPCIMPSNCCHCGHGGCRQDRQRSRCGAGELGVLGEETAASMFPRELHICRLNHFLHVALLNTHSLRENKYSWNSAVE